MVGYWKLKLRTALISAAVLGGGLLTIKQQNSLWLPAMRLML